MSLIRPEYLTFTESQLIIKTEKDTPTIRAAVRRALQQIGGQIHLFCNRRFDWRRDSLEHSAFSVNDGGAVQGQMLWLVDDCQSVEAVLNGDGQTIPGAAYTLLPVGLTPKFRTRIDLRDLTYYWQPRSERARDSIVITGIWGYGGRMRNTLRTLTAEVPDESGTELTVSGLVGLEAGMLLRVDTEYMLIEEVPDSGTTILVERGVNGTIAAEHDSGAALFRFEADEIVQRVCSRILRWARALDDNPLFAVQKLADMEVPVDIDSMPEDVRDLLELIWNPNGTIVGVD